MLIVFINYCPGKIIPTCRLTDHNIDEEKNLYSFIVRIHLIKFATHPKLSSSNFGTKMDFRAINFPFVFTIK